MRGTGFLTTLLIRAPLELLVALFRLPFLFLWSLVALLLLLWERLRRLLRGTPTRPEQIERPCGRLPEAIIRRPDPCLYSQVLLQSLGLPVTWNNPDIWVARAVTPELPEPDSYHLMADTDYVVSVRVHNASTDVALGVRVSLRYRPWSFNSPDRVPVETDGAGNEVFRYVDVMPFASTVTQFAWHTPPVDPATGVKHFCLLADLAHPMDINLANNLGQENTNVYSANPGHVSPGELLTFEVPLFNPQPRPQRFTFRADTYAIDPDDRVQLQRQTNHGYIRWSAPQRIANLLPTLEPATRSAGRKSLAGLGRFRWGSQERLKVVKARYVGFDALRVTIRERDYSLPAGMMVRVHGRPLDAGLDLGPRESVAVPFAVQVPADAVPGSRLALNLNAFEADGLLAGGVTLLLAVRE